MKYYFGSAKTYITIPVRVFNEFYHEFQLNLTLIKKLITKQKNDLCLTTKDKILRTFEHFQGPNNLYSNISLKGSNISNKNYGIKKQKKIIPRLKNDKIKNMIIINSYCLVNCNDAKIELIETFITYPSSRVLSPDFRPLFRQIQGKPNL